MAGSSGGPGPWSVEELTAALAEAYGPVDPGVVRVVRAPGRVNLIGEHTDYNLGFVMPAAIDLEIRIASVPSDGRGVELTQAGTGDRLGFSLDGLSPATATETWIDYPAGVAWRLGELGVPMRGVRGVVAATLPPGAGLSSSAALELATAWSLTVASPPPLPRMELAQAAQRAENAYVGVQCGLMDQFASAYGQAGSALLLDCRSLEHRTVQVPAGYAIVVCDTRAPHDLDVGGAYNERRAQCEAGVAWLRERGYPVSSLRDVTMDMLQAHTAELDPVVFRRCEHIVRENERVLDVEQALAAGDLAAVGRAFAASHVSMRDLFEISTPELDAMVDIAITVPGVIGARMTGGGFGGSTVNLVREDSVGALRDAVGREYAARTGIQPQVFVVHPASGAGLVDPR